MAYNFQTVGWLDWNDDPHRGLPDNVADVQGLLTEYWDEDIPAARDYMWTYVDPPPFDSWVQWDDYISDILNIDYGFDLV